MYVCMYVCISVWISFIIMDVYSIFSYCSNKFMIVIIDDSPARDVISGLIMACTSVPQLIAYAETVGYASYR